MAEIAALDLSSASDEELELQFSPSRWSLRMSAEVVVDNHVRVVKELSDRFRPTLSIPYGKSGWNVPQSYSVNRFIQLTSTAGIPQMRLFHLNS